jgi:hypothetical protein
MKWVAHGNLGPERRTYAILSAGESQEGLDGVHQRRGLVVLTPPPGSSHAGPTSLEGGGWHLLEVRRHERGTAREKIL